MPRIPAPSACHFGQLARPPLAQVVRSYLGCLSPHGGLSPGLVTRFCGFGERRVETQEDCSSHVFAEEDLHHAPQRFLVHNELLEGIQHICREWLLRARIFVQEDQYSIPQRTSWEGRIDIDALQLADLVGGGVYIGYEVVGTAVQGSDKRGDKLE